MRAAVVGVLAGAAAAVILGAAQLIMWAIHAQHYDNDIWKD